MILSDDDPDSQEHRALVMQLLKHLRTSGQKDLPEAFQEVVSAWLVGIRIRLSDALPRSAKIQAEAFPTCLLFHIRIPHADKILYLDHRIDYTMMRKMPLPGQGYLQAEADMLIHRIQQLFDIQQVIGA